MRLPMLAAVAVILSAAVATAQPPPIAAPPPPVVSRAEFNAMAARVAALEWLNSPAKTVQAGPRAVVVPAGMHAHTDIGGKPFIHSDANRNNAAAHADVAFPWNKSAKAGATILMDCPEGAACPIAAGFGVYTAAATPFACPPAVAAASSSYRYTESARVSAVAGVADRVGLFARAREAWQDRPRASSRRSCPAGGCP